MNFVAPYFARRSKIVEILGLAKGVPNAEATRSWLATHTRWNGSRVAITSVFE